MAQGLQPGHTAPECCLVAHCTGGRIDIDVFGAVVMPTVGVVVGVVMVVV